MNNNGEGKSVETSISGNDLYAPDYYYELDTWGTDVDIFEFTLKSDTSMFVVNVGEGKNRGVFLLPKGKQAKPDGTENKISNPTYKTDLYYEIDTWGSNADVFEFTPRSNIDYICVVVGSNHSIQCKKKISVK